MRSPPPGQLEKTPGAQGAGNLASLEESYMEWASRSLRELGSDMMVNIWTAYSALQDPNNEVGGYLSYMQCVLNCLNERKAIKSLLDAVIEPVCNNRPMKLQHLDDTLGVDYILAAQESLGDLLTSTDLKAMKKPSWYVVLAACVLMQNCTDANYRNYQVLRPILKQHVPSGLPTTIKNMAKEYRVLLSPDMYSDKGNVIGIYVYLALIVSLALAYARKMPEGAEDIITAGFINTIRSTTGDTE